MKTSSPTRPMAAVQFGRLALQLLLLGLLLGTGNLRDASAQGLSVGAKGGLNLATLDGEGWEDVGIRGAFAGGVFASFAVSDRFAVQPELMYTGKGAELEVENGVGGFHLSYLEVPVLAKLFLSPRDAARRYTLFAGPVVGFRSGCQLAVRAYGARVAVPCDDPIFEDELAIKRIEYGVLIGGGTEVDLGHSVVVLDARYELGLSSIDGSAAAGDVRNLGLSFLVGISRTIGRGPR